MPQIIYSRNWRGPRPGVSTFSIETTGDAEAIIIEDRLVQYLVSDKGPLERLSEYKQQPKGPTYLEFLAINKHFLNTIQFQFCTALKDYIGDPFKLDLVTKEVTIEQETMKAIVKGAFPARGVAKPSVSVTNNEDIITFWVVDALAAKTKGPPSKFFNLKIKKKKNTKPEQEYSLGSGLTSAAILAQNATAELPKEEDVARDSHQASSESQPDAQIDNTRTLPKNVIAKNMKDPRVLSMHEIFGQLTDIKAQQHRLLLVCHPSPRDELLQNFSWLPEDPELTSESRSRSIPFDLLDINFRIICVLPEDFPRALAYPWPFRAIRFYDGISASTDPLPIYLPNLERINFDSLDVVKERSFFANLPQGVPEPGTKVINHMRETFLEKRRVLEASQESVRERIASLQALANEPGPMKPSMPNYSQGNGYSNGTIAVKSSCDFDLSCRVMKCPAVCITNCEVLEKDGDSFYYQLPGSPEKLRKCSNCTCSLSLHKIQPRSASLVNKPFSLTDLTNPSAETNKIKAEARRRQEEAKELARVQEAHRTKMSEWSAANFKRTSEMAKMESELADLGLQLDKLSAELIVVKDCCTRWDEALENWNDKNS